MASPYFDSANRQIDESKKGLLEAVATGGSAGKAAFDAAQAQAAQARQDAVARAAQRSALYGVGGDQQTFLGAYDARMNQMNVNRSNFESGLAQTQASGESYLDKARASIPVLEAQNLQKVTDQETKIKTAIEAARQKAEAERLKAEEAERRTLEREQRAEARTIARENRAAARDAAKQAKKDNTPSNQGLLGLAAQAAKQSVNPAINPKAAGPVRPSEQAARTKPDQGLTDLAVQIGRSLGIPDAQLAELYAPSQQSSLATNLQKPEQLLAQTSPDIKWLTANVRGMDTKKAQQALAAPEFKEAGNQVASYFAIAPLDEDGLISDGSVYEGLKPREALRRYIYSQPGNLTMKDAVMQYYGRMLPA